MRYHRLGNVPPKRHTVFKNPSGGIYYEELVGAKGFSGRSSLLYHIHRPTKVKSTRLVQKVKFEEDTNRGLRMRHLRTGQLPQGGSPVLDRCPLLFNSDVTISAASPDISRSAAAHSRG